MQVVKRLFIVSTVCSAAYAQATAGSGYDCQPNCISPSIPTSNTTLSFGQHYAVLNLDLINVLIDSIANTTSGKAFIQNTANWIDAVHAQNPPPLSIFTRVYYSSFRKPELRAGIPFSEIPIVIGDSSDPKTKINSAFKVDKKAGDVVLQKTRYYAGFGNNLEGILSTQQIDTVILSGLSTSGVILSTVYSLFDLNYNVYVIANNTIQPGADAVNAAILEGIIPKLPANVITIEQATAALKRSGPAIY